MRAVMSIYNYGCFGLIKYLSADIGGPYDAMGPLQLIRNAYMMIGYHDANGCNHV
jgi:hypothetical protein